MTIAPSPTTNTPMGRSSDFAVSYRLTGARLLRSELLRFTTVRTNLPTIAAFALLMVLIGVIAAATSSGDVDGLAPEADPHPASPHPTP